jgi:hypothetical protein
MRNARLGELRGRSRRVQGRVKQECSENEYEEWRREGKPEGVGWDLSMDGNARQRIVGARQKCIITYPAVSEVEAQTF